jgi:hypothetical protein
VGGIDHPDALEWSHDNLPGGHELGAWRSLATGQDITNPCELS